MTYLTTTLADQKTNISFQMTTVTSHQDVNNTWTLVEGGQMNYTPTSSSAEVMVEFTTAYGRKDPDVSAHFKLQIGDDTSSMADITTENEEYTTTFGTVTVNNTTNISDIITLKYKLTGWSGQKVLLKTYWNIFIP